MGWVIARCCVLILGLAAVWTGVDLAGEPYRQAVEFRNAKTCTGGNEPPESSKCLVRESAQVTDRGTREVVTGVGEDQNVKTEYTLSIRRTAGETEVYDVSRGLYGAASQGDPADLEIWRGEVVVIGVGDERDRFTPSSASSLVRELMLAWIGAGLVLSSALRMRASGTRSEGPVMVVIRAGCWLVLGLATLVPTSEIVAHGSVGWKLLGWAVIWLVVAAVTVPLMLKNDIGRSRRWPPWRRGGGPAR